ncbi:hypothetical protein AB0J47_41130 [Nocardia sp. NPDC049737]|uniref:hypothetical protein n=1 Tax=Nocardia sp. NPDC049737 TaxID=3154358 RepID=UPI003437AB49
MNLSTALSLAAQRSANDGVMTHQAVTDRLGLHVTDLRGLILLRIGGPATAGELAHAHRPDRRHHHADDRPATEGAMCCANTTHRTGGGSISVIQERIDEIAPHYEVVAREFAVAMAGIRSSSWMCSTDCTTHRYG